MRSTNKRGRCHRVKKRTSAGSSKGAKRGGYVSRVPKETE